MGHLAGAFSALGRYQDAVVMEEQTLEFLRRVLPENHPNIGSTGFCCLLIEDDDVTLCTVGMSMSSLVPTYSGLGRHQDALVMGEKALEFLRRVLPENDIYYPHIGST